MFMALCCDIPIKVVNTAINSSGESDGGVVSIIPEYSLTSAEIVYAGDGVGYIGADFAAGRSYVTIPLTGVTLGALGDIAFKQNTSTGYPVSVNILLDIDGDGKFEPKKDLTTGYLTNGVDEVLKLEWAHHSPSSGVPPYTVSGDYNEWIGVFNNIDAIDSTSIAWLYSEAPGPGIVGCAHNTDTLANWIVGGSRATTCCYVSDIWYTESCDSITIDTNTVVYGIQIESLGWISASDSQVKDITIGGVIQDVMTIEPSQTIDFDVTTKFANGAMGDYTITTNIEVQ